MFTLRTGYCPDVLEHSRCREARIPEIHDENRLSAHSTYVHTCTYTYLQINLYSAKNRITNQRRSFRAISRCYSDFEIFLQNLQWYPTPGMGVECCDEPVSLSVCPRTYLRNRTSRLNQIFFECFVAAAQFSSPGVAIRYVLLVLWMTSYANGGVSLPQQRCARANAPAAWYGSCTTAGTRTRRVVGARDARAEYAMYHFLFIRDSVTQYFFTGVIFCARLVQNVRILQT